MSSLSESDQSAILGSSALERLDAGAVELDAEEEEAADRDANAADTGASTESPAFRFDLELDAPSTSEKIDWLNQILALRSSAADTLGLSGSSSASDSSASSSAASISSSESAISFVKSGLYSA